MERESWDDGSTTKIDRLSGQHATSPYVPYHGVHMPSSIHERVCKNHRGGSPIDGISPR